MHYSKLKALLMKRFNLPKERTFARAIRSFTIAEKAVFYFFTALFVLSGILLVWRVNHAYLREVPIEGGSLTEGVIGNPRFINPVLAMSEADRNLASLIYSGLVRITPEGEIVNDLADSISVSDDGLIYTVHIREDAVFHDSVRVTADDVVFTIEKILDPDIKSPHFGDFAGVITEKIDERTIIFTLRKPYTPFIYNLSLGILPHHIWGSVTADEFSFSEWNTLPIGSGPYTISAVERNSAGIPDYYHLMAFEQNGERDALIENLVFRFYSNESDLLEAFDDGELQSISGISASDAYLLKREGAHVLSTPLPRVFGVFFNQSENKTLLDGSVRKALDLVAPKEEIIETVLYGYGTAIDTPLPPGLFENIPTRIHSSSIEERIIEANRLLTEAGWVKNEHGVFEKTKGSDTLTLSFSISTGNTPELREVGEMLRRAWTDFGAHVDLLIFDTGDLNQNVIRARQYDALLFGEVVGRDADVYPFWHSSERNDPGLNIALYTNSNVDKLLEEARAETDMHAREALYKSFTEEIVQDTPAVFLYSPSFIYVVPKAIKGVDLGKLSRPEDRFLGVRNWFVETDNVWTIFAE